MNLTQRTQRVREEALRLGFDGCGFSKAQRLEKEERRLEEWLNQGRHGSMGWMENYFDKRVDPTKLVPGSKSVVSVIGSYYHPDHERQQQESGKPKIAKYAQGRDYHKVYKGKLKKLFNFTKELVGNIHGRIFVDSAPVLDKAWAARSGLGWIGKNSNLLNKDIGSFFFIGEMIIDVEFIYSTQVTDHCGTCTRCIDACPTNAIYEPYRVDSNKCISYLTIELKDQIPEKHRNDLGQWMYGCDICQDVCP
ncbi:MAG: tRNA epoxyqueuosine(34) reductase QueG, partial [Candidatus Halalkalibacterium sp. M3_1C_030]